MTTRRTFLGAAAATALTAHAIAQGRQQWRMVTSWPRDLPGPGVSARRIAERISLLSGGRIEVHVHGAGEIVPGLGVFDAVAAGVAQVGHSASFFWASKMPAAQVFTTLPFGLVPAEHQAWLEHGGGQGHWDALYAPFGVKPLPGGNTGPSMAGWFSREIAGPDDLRGLRIRVAGIGAEMYRRLGASPVLTAPGEVFTALRSGVIDAVEFLGPSADLAQGLHQAARFYYAPGVTKPNGSSELLIAKPIWDGLPGDLKMVVSAASQAEVIAGLSEAEHQNAIALEVLRDRHGIRPRSLPADVLGLMRTAARDALADLVARDPSVRPLWDSYGAAVTRSRAWSAACIEAYLHVRNSDVRL